MVKKTSTRPISLPTAVFFGTALAALLVIALFPVFPRQLQIRVGDTAARTVRAPEEVNFESGFLTRQRREEAAAAVPLALVFDDGVRADQLEEYDRVTAQVTQARALVDETRKRDALASLDLSPRSVDTAAALTAERWLAVASEGRRILAKELAVSRDDAAVAQLKDSIDALVSPEFGADEAILTAEIVRPRIVTTLTVDDEQTQADREAASAGEPPQLVNVKKGDIILSADARVDEVAIEKLRETGLLSQRVEWRNVVAVVILAAAAAYAVAGFLFVTRPPSITSERHLIALAVVMVLPLLVAKFYLPFVMPQEERYFLAFVLPAAAAPMLIAALLNTQAAVIVAAVTGVLMALIAALLPDVSLVTSVGALDIFRLLLVYGLAPLAGIFVVHGADRLNRYVSAGIVVTAGTFLLLLATWFIDNGRENADLGFMALAAVLNGTAAGLLAAGAFVTVGVLFGVTTRVQLMELSQLNAPLLRRLQDEAPGTFHHSVIVGNLAERAADLVGADALLTRVGCYYHDIGKVLQPGMYIENQMGGDSPHDTMAPQESAEVIQQHVREGAELARRERLPARVQAFIPEHHGTRLVAYFYRIAAERDPAVDPALFQYPGPRPQSKETAIVMLADSTEAVVRSSSDRSAEAIDRIVDEVIAERLAEGQLDDSDLTLRDLRTVAESFKGTMRAVYHPRVQYPLPTPMETRRRMLRLPLRAPTPRDGAPPVERRRRER